MPKKVKEIPLRQSAATSDLPIAVEQEDLTFDDLPETPQNPSLDKDTIKKRTVSGAISYFATTLVLNLVGLIANFFLMAYLSESDFGIYGFVAQISGLLVFFSDIGLASSLIQKKEEPTAKDYHTVFWTQQALSWLIVAVCLIIFATGFVKNQVGLSGNWILLAIAISFPLSTLKTVSSIKLSRQMKFSKIVIPQIFEQLVYNLILIFLAIKGFGASAYAVAIFARSVVGVIVMNFIQPYLPRFQFDFPSFKQTIKFGSKFQANDLLARIKDNFFYITIGSILGPVEFGYISWAKQWSMYPYNLTVQNIMNITFPTFSRLQHDPKLLAKAIEKSLFFITLVIFPLIAGMCVFISPLTQVIPAYAKWIPAIPAFVFFTLSIAWSAISSPLTNTLNAIGKINWTLKLMVFWTILTWALTFPLMWIFGYNGVAFAAFLISFTSIIPYFMAKKIVKFKLWPNIWRQLLAAAAMAFVSLLTLDFWNKDLTSLIIGAIIAGGVYIITLALFGYKKTLTEIKSLRTNK